MYSKKMTPTKNLALKLTLRLYDPNWDFGKLGTRRASEVVNAPGPLSYQPKYHKPSKPGTIPNFKTPRLDRKSDIKNG